MPKCPNVNGAVLQIYVYRPQGVGKKIRLPGNPDITFVWGG